MKRKTEACAHQLLRQPHALGELLDPANSCPLTHPSQTPAKTDKFVMDHNNGAPTAHRVQKAEVR